MASYRNFDEVFDSPGTSEIPEEYEPHSSISDQGPQMMEENIPHTQLRWTPSINLVTPKTGKCISLAHRRAFAKQKPHDNDSPMPMPRTNPNHARGSNHDVSPLRYPGDGEASPPHPVVSRTNTDTGSLYQVEINEDQQDNAVEHNTGTTAPGGASFYSLVHFQQDNAVEHNTGTAPGGASFDASFNLVDASPPSSERLVALGGTPVDLCSVFAASNTPQNDFSIDVTPAPTVCSSSYQAQLGSELSAATAMSQNHTRDSVSSCQTHRLDFYQPPDPQEMKTVAQKLKIAYGVMIIGGSIAIASIIALIVEDPLNIIHEQNVD